MKWDVQFPEDPILRPVRGRGTNFDRLGAWPVVINGQRFVLQEQRTDLASIPKIEQAALANDDGVILMPSLWHDKGYGDLGRMTSDSGETVEFTREQLDEQLRDGMLACGATLIEREAAFLEVRAGGWVFWNKHAQLHKGITLTHSTAHDHDGFLADAVAVQKTIDAYFGVSRSPQWPAMERQVIAEEKVCQWCGGKTLLQVHHIAPFHLHPELELKRPNLITLCMAPGFECHFQRGHNGTSWLDFNPGIRKQCDIRKSLGAHEEGIR